MTELHITDIARVIQLAIAPVFLLTAVGTIIGVLSNRLARIVDRTRVLEERVGEQPDTSSADAELLVLGRRMRLSYLAIGLSVVCALFISLLIVLAFVDAFLSLDLSKVIGLLFIAGMLAFIASLLALLREIFLAVASAHQAMRLKLPAQRILAAPAERGSATLPAEERAAK
jgi:MFS family permease